MRDPFDIGPTPPSWVLPGARPGWDGGAGVLDWIRDIGAVWIGASDSVDEAGEWMRSEAMIQFCELPCGLNAAGARGLAADLIEAADQLEEHR